MVVRALKLKLNFDWNLVWNLDWMGEVYDVIRSRMFGLGGGARKAMAKSPVEEGDEGVTMIAGRGDFSEAKGRERSSGAGTSAQSRR